MYMLLFLKSKLMKWIYSALTTRGWQEVVAIVKIMMNWRYLWRISQIVYIVHKIFPQIHVWWKFDRIYREKNKSKNNQVKYDW